MIRGPSNSCLTSSLLSSATMSNDAPSNVPLSCTIPTRGSSAIFSGGVPVIVFHQSRASTAGRPESGKAVTRTCSVRQGGAGCIGIVVKSRTPCANVTSMSRQSPNLSAGGCSWRRARAAASAQVASEATPLETALADRPRSPMNLAPVCVHGLRAARPNRVSLPWYPPCAYHFSGARPRPAAPFRLGRPECQRLLRLRRPRRCCAAPPQQIRGCHPGPLPGLVVADRPYRHELECNTQDRSCRSLPNGP